MDEIQGGIQGEEEVAGLDFAPAREEDVRGRIAVVGAALLGVPMSLPEARMYHDPCSRMFQDR